MMIWNKPKKTLLNVLTYAGIIFGIICLVVIATLLIWSSTPGLIKSFDKMIPNFHEFSFKRAYKSVKKTVSEEEKLIGFKKLYAKTRDLSPMEQSYKYKVISSEYLIYYYLDNNEVEKAFNIAQQWKDSNSFDFNAKFAYLKVLERKNNEMAMVLYEELYLQYPNLQEVTERYILYLIKNNMISRAVTIEDRFNAAYSLNRISFMLYYVEGKKTNFNAKQLVKLNYKRNAKNYKIELSQDFNKLKDLRFDIDSALIGTKVSNMKISISKNGKVYENVKISSIHSIKNLKNDAFTIGGKDPHVRVELPDAIKGSSGLINISMSFDVKEEINYTNDHLLKKKE